MRFSVSLPTSYEGLGYPIGMLREPAALIRLARAAEAFGFDAVWANDHLTTPAFLAGAAGGPPTFYEALISLAVVAGATSRIGLGTAVLALPLREPVLLAKQAAALDALSGGRLLLGVGLGAYPEELAALRPGVAPHPRAARLDEGIAALRRLLDEGGGTFRGAHLRFEGIELTPRPARRPFPLYIGGHGHAAIARAARWGQGWLPGWRPIPELAERIARLRALTAEAGRDVRSVEVAPELSATIARTTDDAVARYERSRFVRHRVARDAAGRDGTAMARANLVGDAATIRERVAELAAAGVDHVAALAFPAESVDELLEQWRMFAEEVL